MIEQTGHAAAEEKKIKHPIDTGKIVLALGPYYFRPRPGQVT